MANKIKFNYIIFHRGCLDGFSGFFVAHISGRLTNDVEIYPDVPSATKVPPNIENTDIIIIDVAYKKNILESIFKNAHSVVFIDHHISIRNDVDELHKKYNHLNNINIIFDSDRCGSTLAWKYFFSRQKIPLFLKYVEDQDTGKWVYPNTKPFIYALKSYYHLSTENKSLNKWFRLLNKENIIRLIKKGKIIKRYNQHLVNINLPRHSLERFPSKKIYNHAITKTNESHNIFEKPGQYKVVIYNGFNCPSVTDLANEALQKIECDFCIMWVQNLDKDEYVLTMRSKDIDVSKIAQIFGGGGHKLAAACSFPVSQFRIEELFEGESLPRTIKE